MLIEWTLVCYSRYKTRRLRCHLEPYPAYLLKDMGLRVEGKTVFSDREEVPSSAPPPAKQAPPKAARTARWRVFARRG